MKKILELAKEKNQYKRKFVTKQEAIQYFTKNNNEYKLELINDLEDGKITFYQQGQFIDLCKGPHIPHTGHIKAVKLLNVAGAYWKGDEKNKQLTRIYGISFPKQKELSSFLERLEEAKKRDHRKIGKNMSLFMFSKKVGQGLPLWLPKGAYLRSQLVDFMKKHNLNLDTNQLLHHILDQKNYMYVPGIMTNMAKTPFNQLKLPMLMKSFF